MHERMIVGRVGWMKFYNGPQAGDERPEGGGEWNDRNLGYEAFNFQNRDGICYGYFQPAPRASGLNLVRVEPDAEGESLDNVTVVFVAREPQRGGQVIIGWYRNATVYRTTQESGDKRRKEFPYVCSAPYRDACLLPTANRAFVIPKGKGALGQANVGYVFDDAGRRIRSPWINEALAYIDGYAGVNVLREPVAEAEAEILVAAEKALSGRSGQRFGGTADERKAIENRAMDAAKSYFRDEGYSCEDVHQEQSYDLLCTRAERELHVEVKGTQGAPTEVFLTRGEVCHARNNPGLCALFVLHGINLRKTANKITATGGAQFVLNPWELDGNALEGVLYSYRLPSGDTGARK